MTGQHELYTGAAQRFHNLDSLTICISEACTCGRPLRATCGAALNRCISVGRAARADPDKW
jgi:hypothetical protein